MGIQKTNFVEAHYTLREENEEGKIIENTTGKDPLNFVFGVGMMIPGFEANIEGMEPGEKMSFVVPAEEAYGLFIEDNVIELPLENFGDEEERKEHIVVDKQIALSDQAGNEHIGVVSEIGETTVKIDFNHPLAGYDLYFAVEILSIRETSREELMEMGLQFEG